MLSHTILKSTLKTVTDNKCNARQKKLIYNKDKQFVVESSQLLIHTSHFQAAKTLQHHKISKQLTKSNISSMRKKDKMKC